MNTHSGTQPSVSSTVLMKYPEQSISYSFFAYSSNNESSRYQSVDARIMLNQRAVLLPTVLGVDELAWGLNLCIKAHFVFSSLFSVFTYNSLFTSNIREFLFMRHIRDCS